MVKLVPKLKINGISSLLTNLPGGASTFTSLVSSTLLILGVCEKYSSSLYKDTLLSASLTSVISSLLARTLSLTGVNPAYSYNDLCVLKSSESLNVTVIKLTLLFLFKIYGYYARDCTYYCSKNNII